MSSIFAIASKDIKLLVRDGGGLFWVLGFPILIAMFFGAIFGNEGPTAAMSVTVVDQDASTRSKAFVKQLGKSASLKIDQKRIEEAKTLVRKGDRVAYIVIPKGFGEAPLFGPGDKAALEIGQDPKRKAESGFLQGMVTQAWFAQMQETMKDPKEMKRQTDDARNSLQDATGMDPSQRQAILSMLDNMETASSFGGFTADAGMQGPEIKSTTVTTEGAAPASAFEVTFPQGILWGLFGVAMAFSVGLVKERTMGTFQRLRISPVTSGQLLAGKALACFLMSMLVMAVLLAFGLVVGVRVFQNPLGILLAVVCSSICFTGLMMLLNIFGKTEEAVGGAGRAVLLIFSMIGGGMIPVIAMPPWMLSASQVSPVRWTIAALEGAIWRGYSLGEMLLPCAVLLGVGAVGYGVGVWAVGRQES